MGPTKVLNFFNVIWMKNGVVQIPLKDNSIVSALRHLKASRFLDWFNPRVMKRHALLYKTLGYWSQICVLTVVPLISCVGLGKAPKLSEFIFKKRAVTLRSHGHYEENNAVYVNSTNIREVRVRAHSSFIQCLPEFRWRNGNATEWGWQLPAFCDIVGRWQPPKANNLWVSIHRTCRGHRPIPDWLGDDSDKWKRAPSASILIWNWWYSELKYSH